MTPEPERDERRRRPVVWWLSPGWIIPGLVIPVSFLAFLLPPDTYESLWRVPKYFDGAALLRILGSIGTYFVGVKVAGVLWGGGPHSRQWQDRIHWRRLWWLFQISFWLCLFGYAAWGWSAYSHGLNWDLLREAFLGPGGGADEIKNEYMTTIGGITTCTQFGIATVILGGVLAARLGWRAVWMPYAIVFGLATVRAVANSERLALIELVVPAVAVIVALHASQWRLSPALAALLRYAPLWAVAGLFVMFTMSESLRSWAAYYSGGDTGLAAFGGLRLTGYYVTAMNNSAFLLQKLDLPLRAPFFSLNFLWRMPGLSAAVASVFPNIPIATPDAYLNFLSNGANPEWTNASAMLLPMMDYGAATGMLYWMGIGFAAGALYQSFLSRAPWGLALYPIVYLGLIETPRILYLSTGRIVPAVTLLAVGAVWMGRAGTGGRP